MFQGQLIDSFKRAERLPLCLSFLDLLIQAAQTQNRFLEMIFDSTENQGASIQELFKTFIYELENRQNESNQYYADLSILLKYKMTIFISLLSQKRICQKFTQFNDSKFISTLMNSVVLQHCLKMSSSFDGVFNGSYLEPFH